MLRVPVDCRALEDRNVLAGTCNEDWLLAARSNEPKWNWYLEFPDGVERTDDTSGAA